MTGATQFYRSQVGDGSVINYGYTDMPWHLLVKDMYYFFVYLWALPWILMPAWPFPSDDFCELYPSKENMFCIVLHVVLVIIQLIFVLALPVCLFFPLWIVIPALAAFFFLNWLLTLFLNGSGRTFHSDPQYAAALPEHEHEQWVFLNGVAVGEHWMKSNLNRLALTFGRPIMGIHNQTSGIIFDVVECLIQRNFSYATQDVRICYKLLKDVLYDPSKSKVVFILHSQGGIEGGLVLDWLLQEMPQDLLAKLEVYTFGNAANHFNNPHRHVVSQALAEGKILEEANTSSPIDVTQNENMITRTSRRSGSRDDNFKPPKLAHQSSSVSKSSFAARDRAIGHIEHYAHATDFVALWGVLHFATNRMDSVQLPRFLGRLFARSHGKGGHLLNQHYLDGMFPLARNLKTKKLIGADEHNEFMEEVIEIGQEGQTMENVREAFEITYAGTDGFGSGDIDTPVRVHGVPKLKGKEGLEIKVKHLSRLWKYRNGQSPAEPPPMLLIENGVAKSATM